MKFIVGYPTVQPLTAFLIPNNWDDWFRYETLHSLVIFDEKGDRISAGEVKIGERGQYERRPSIPQTFETLAERFFSLGQDENYYEAICSLPKNIRDQIFLALRDCAYDLSIFQSARYEDVMKVSLLRFVDPQTVRNRFNRLAHGNTTLTEFNFSYDLPRPNDTIRPLSLAFSVIPDSNPPTNIHVIIGRNGVGKTRCFRLMSHALIKGNSIEDFGIFKSLGNNDGTSIFANLVSVAFSAFDEFDPLPVGKSKDYKIRYEYIGLRRPPENQNKISDATATAKPSSPSPKIPDELADEFVESLLKCHSGPRKERWQDAIKMLATDHLFEEANIADLILIESEKALAESAKKTFERLSSGHKIVLLTITRLVELVDERTLVLIDEPEAHLHPPLLATFIRVLSFLLIKRNGVAIIATHSPVVLQETPRSCVWVMFKSGALTTAHRPDVETFGENVGLLTREVFGLEVTHSGFHRHIREVADKVQTYEELLSRFSAQLGAEARVIPRALITSKTKNSDCQ